MVYIELINIYYRQTKDIPEYLDIFFETNIGMLKLNIRTIHLIEYSDLEGMTRAEEIETFRGIYGPLYINEARVSYDNNIYILISGKLILAIEYSLNSNFKYSVQEFRVIENIHTSNKHEFDDFKELEIVQLPSLPE
jgi:hypothetical protein